MISQLSDFLNLSEKSIENLFYTIFTILLFIVIRIITSSIIRRNIKDEKRSYNLRKTFTYVYSALLIYAISSVWLNGMQSIGTFLGLTSAGLAIALHDTIANLAGFIFIETRKPFRVGDRVEINGHQGDVIDIRLFQFSIVEVGNWVDADQSTGRIIHVPNNMVLKHPTANSHVGFEYIWNEVPILITFESDWKKAKQIMIDILQEKTESLSQGAQNQIRRAARKYLIVAGKLTPTVYTSVKDSGIMLTMRYLVNPRMRRGTEQKIWEEILDAFEKEDKIELAYPTVRYFTQENHQSS
ncbi:MAG: mechanosensitive ion channel protein MscS [Kiritimatiellaceae bacterium]|nr:mechanosensitive ion channel protein MscS [Kiritimatiellaceae bacterium]|tara:strand:+ start:1729 stop:2622 length:894 start_codon:yes stop_codon:yes gene_type:complete